MAEVAGNGSMDAAAPDGGYPGSDSLAGPSSSSSRSPTPPLTPPEPIAPLASTLLQSIYSSYPVPISLPFPPAQNDPAKRTVCKHWLRGLCKKSDATCDYLHEYDMRKMPECRMFSTFGFCNNGDECLYRHKLPVERRRQCEEYKRGFCPKGPLCEKKHTRRIACPYYLAGFCPKGPECHDAHPKSTVPSAESRRSSPILTHKPLSAEEAFAPPAHLREGGGGGGGGQDYGDQNRGAGGERGGYTSRGRGGSHMVGDRPQRPPGGGVGGGDQQRGPKRDLSTVTCFKCGETGHYANNCPNPNRPGNRGGTERIGGGRERGEGSGRAPMPY